MSGPKKRKWMTSWIPHRLEFLISPAWHLAPIPLRRMLERIEIEHLRHGGFNNGELYVSYQQLVAHGLSRRSIKSTQELGNALGLLEVFQDESHKGDLRPPNRYRLTYLPAKNAAAPTDEWKAISADRAEVLVATFKAADKASAKAKRRKVA